MVDLADTAFCTVLIASISLSREQMNFMIDPPGDCWGYIVSSVDHQYLYILSLFFLCSVRTVENPANA